MTAGTYETTVDARAIDQEYRFQVNPDFETESDLLQQTILDQAGERLTLLDENVVTDYGRITCR